MWQPSQSPYISVMWKKTWEMRATLTYFQNGKRYHIENLCRSLFLWDFLLDGDKTFLKVLAILEFGLLWEYWRFRTSGMQTVFGWSELKMLLLILHVECLKGFYKSVANNRKCDKCPANSASNTGRTGCLCNDGFYKKSELAPCKGKYMYYTQDISRVQFIFGSVIDFSNPWAISPTELMGY